MADIIKNRAKGRTESEWQTINAAKALLIRRKQMSENEAHHYIQKLSMDSATNMVETAEMILLLNQKK